MRSKTKKILEITPALPLGGWALRVAYVKRELLRIGHVCEIINIAVETRKIPSPDYITARNGLDYLVKVLYKSFRGYRVHMHLNGDSPKAFILTIIAEIANLLSLKSPVLTFHAGPFQKYFPKERAPQLTLMYKFIFGIAGKIICNSEHVKEKIVEYGISPEKVIPIQAFSSQYIDFSPIPLSDNLVRFLADKKIIISSYVSYFTEAFFIDDMLRSITEITKRHQGVGFLILGSETGSESAKRLVNELGISAHVFFTGDLDHHHFLTIFARSDICLRTPIRDGVSSSVLEALALGVPVVASENNRRPESTITYSHENPDDMVRALDETIKNLPEMKEKIVKPHIRDTIADEMKILLDW